MAPVPERSEPGTRVIARRSFQLAPDHKRITVTLEVPEPDPESLHDDWRCAYRITGLGQSGRRYAYGIDAFQALQLAMVGIRSCLEPHRTRLSWAGGALEAAFPMYVPYSWGPRYTRRLEKSMHREVTDLCREIQTRAKSKEQAKRKKREG